MKELIEFIKDFYKELLEYYPEIKNYVKFFIDNLTPYTFLALAFLIYIIFEFFWYRWKKKYFLIYGKYKKTIPRSRKGGITRKAKIEHLKKMVENEWKK